MVSDNDPAHTPLFGDVAEASQNDIGELDRVCQVFDESVTQVFWDDNGKPVVVDWAKDLQPLVDWAKDWIVADHASHGQVQGTQPTEAGLGHEAQQTVSYEQHGVPEVQETETGITPQVREAEANCVPMMRRAGWKPGKVKLGRHATQPTERATVGDNDASPAYTAPGEPDTTTSHYEVEPHRLTGGASNASPEGDSSSSSDDEVVFGAGRYEKVADVSLFIPRFYLEPNLISYQPKKQCLRCTERNMVCYRPLSSGSTCLWCKKDRKRCTWPSGVRHAPDTWMKAVDVQRLRSGVAGVDIQGVTDEIYKVADAVRSCTYLLARFGSMPELVSESRDIQLRLRWAGAQADPSRLPGAAEVQETTEFGTESASSGLPRARRQYQRGGADLP